MAEASDGVVAAGRGAWAGPCAPPRGSRLPWTDDGLDALRFTNYATPPNRPLAFWVDDVVMATERVGCE